MTNQAKTQPDYYEGVLTAESSELRAGCENELDALYAALPEKTGVKRLKHLKAIDRLEQRLAWQGANPKALPFDELKEHIRHPQGFDPIEDKYRARIGNRATAIRSYCVWCQGGSVIGVKECPSVICPLHSFRMGTDPLRGYELPKAAPVEIPEDDADDALFEEGDDADEKDATE
jgi:hypothetical protein